jgi:hypothetical protein
MIIIVLVVIGWLACSFLTYGMFLGYFTKHYPVSKNFGDAILFSLGGPFAALVGARYALHNKEFNFRIKPLTTEERFEKFNEKYGILGREYFDENYN